MRKTRTAASTAVTSAVIVAALIVGLGFGYLGSTISNKAATTTVVSNNTTTEMVVSTYTTTVTLLQGTYVLQCIVSQYVVKSLEFIGSSTTYDGTTTSTSPFQTYQSTTSGVQSVGYATTWTIFTGTGSITTETGYRTWNGTVCTVIKK